MKYLFALFLTSTALGQEINFQGNKYILAMADDISVRAEGEGRNHFVVRIDSAEVRTEMKVRFLNGFPWIDTFEEQVKAARKRLYQGKGVWAFRIPHRFKRGLFIFRTESIGEYFISADKLLEHHRARLKEYEAEIERLEGAAAALETR